MTTYPIPACPKHAPTHRPRCKACDEVLQVKYQSTRAEVEKERENRQHLQSLTDVYSVAVDVASKPLRNLRSTDLAGLRSAINKVTG